jgi:hypothetical protein
MRIIPLLFLPIVLVFICALILLWLPLPKPFPPALSQGRNLFAAISVGILGVGYMIGLTVYLVALPIQAARELDPVFVPAGFASRSYMLFGRKYAGTYRERAFDVFYFPPQRGKPASLNVYLDVATGMRMALGQQRPLLDCRRCAAVFSNEPELAGLEMFAENESRARDLIADLDARLSLKRLLRVPADLGSREVYVQPERVWFRAYPNQLSGEQIWQWLNDLIVIASTAQSEPD